MKIVLRTTAICFLLLVGFHCVHIRDTAQWMGQDALPYLVHTGVQLFVEMSLITVIGWWLQRRQLPGACALWLTAAIWWSLLHLLDLHMVRLMDFSLAHAAHSTLDEGWSNFVEILRASNVPLSLYGGAVAGIVAFTGWMVWAFRRSLIAESERARPSIGGAGVWTGLACLSLLGATALMDCTGADPGAASGAQKLKRALPWKRRMVELQVGPQLELYPRAQAWNGIGPTADSFHKNTLSLAAKPPILLFVIESLRADALNATTAPHLTAFGQRHFASSLSFSNANATPLSWMAILTGLQPSRWGSSSVAAMRGSPALQGLQRAGYALHVHTASRLSYYQMDQKLFGPQRQMLASCFESPPELGIEAWQRDSQVLHNLQQSLANGETDGHLHIVFLEATHFGYSWPEEQTVDLPIESPSAGLMTFWKLSDVQGLRNRYTNAIRHLDQKIGDFLAELKRQDLYERAQIVITSDHGEEFFEHGHLFHASALDDEQVHVPLFWKVHAPQGVEPPRDLVVSHVDILPSLLHSLTGSERAGAGLDGNSIFSTHHPRHSISWRYNFQAPPHEFVVHTATSTLRASLNEPRAPLRSSQAIVETASCDGRCVPTRTLLQDPALSSALDRFFAREPARAIGTCSP
jgi:hypothetical protein